MHRQEDKRAASVVIDLCEEEEEEEIPPASSFFQLRDHISDPHRSWALSFEEMLEPAETVTHVLISTFGHARSQLVELRRRLEARCPRLEDVCLVSDWHSTDGVGATKGGPVDEGEGYTRNPHAVCITPGDGFRVRCTVVYPPLAGDEPERHEAKGRAKHSIQHTKLCMVRHTAATHTPPTGGLSGSCGAALAGAHLRIHVMSCNVDNVLSQKGEVGDVIWRSPPLDALPAGTTRPELVLPSSAVGRRFGHPLYKMLRAMTERAVESAQQQSPAASGACAGDDASTAAAVDAPAAHKEDAPAGSHTPFVREWSDMLAAYDLTQVPEDAHLVFSMPGCHPAERHSRDEEGSSSSVLGRIGGRLMCWNYDATYARNLAAVVTLCRKCYGMDKERGPFVLELANAADRPTTTPDGTARPLIHLEPETGNVYDANAFVVYYLANSEWHLPIGRLSRRDAAGLRELYAAGAVSYRARLEIFFRQGEVPAVEGGVVLPPELMNAAAYLDVAIMPIAGVSVSASVPASAWLNLASALRCNLGLGRLREVLRSTGPWPLDECTSFASVSASLGQSGVSFLGSFAAAADDNDDLDAWPKDRLLAAIAARSLAMPGGGTKDPAVGTLRELLRQAISEQEDNDDPIGKWPKPRCIEAVLQLGLPMPTGEPKEPTVPMLREVLRPYVQPGVQLPSLVLPAGHAAGALMGNTRSFADYLDQHKTRTAAGAPPFLCNLDIDALPTPIGVHPCVAAEHKLTRTFARRLTHSHGKVVVRTFEAGGGSGGGDGGSSRFGWCYIGSHNFSATAWGSPWVHGLESDGSIDMLQLSSWELGVVLTVPRGTPREQAEARMGFESWPIQFDERRLHGYGPADELSAHDSFAILEAVKAKRQGEANWQAHIRPEVRERMEAQAQANYLRDLEEVFLDAVKYESVTGGGGSGGDGDYDDDDKAQVAAAFAASLQDQARGGGGGAGDEDDYEAQIAAAIAASLQDGHQKSSLASSGGVVLGAKRGARGDDDAAELNERERARRARLCRFGQ
jgi:hypothetical protein